MYKYSEDIIEYDKFLIMNIRNTKEIPNYIKHHKNAQIWLHNSPLVKHCIIKVLRIEYLIRISQYKPLI